MTLDHSTLATIPKLIARVLELEEAPVEEVFSQAGLDYTSVMEHSDRVPMSQMHQLWEQAAEATGNESLGLLAASVFQPAYLKGIGLAWIASENLGQGLERFIKNISMVNTAVKVELVHEGDHVTLRYLPLTKDSTQEIKAHPCAIQLGLGFLLRMFRIAASRPIPVAKVYVKHEISSDSKKDYEAFFECSVQHKHDFNGIEFDASVLEEPLPAADRELAELNDQAIVKYLEVMGQATIVKKVSECVVPLLASGCPTESEIALRLHMSRRTLQRRLSAAETSYGKVLASLRNNMAKACLRNVGTSVTDVAYQLGYSSPSTFARAFKQVEGVSPNEFREQSLSD